MSRNKKKGDRRFRLRGGARKSRAATKYVKKCIQEILKLKAQTSNLVWQKNTIGIILSGGREYALQTTIQTIDQLEKSISNLPQPTASLFINNIV